MKIYRHKLRLIIHLTLLVASCVWSTMLFIEGNLVFGGFIVLIVLHCSYSIVVHYSMIAKKVAFMFDAVENDDFTFRFTGNRQQINSDQMLNESLNRIKELVLDARMTAKEREKYYELILSNIQSGIMVFNKSGVIFQVNHRVLELFGLSQLTHIRQLDLTQEKLSQHFFSLKDGESAMVKFYNEVGEVSISISAVHLVLRGIPLKIVSLTDIAANLDSQEIENWQRISRVLTHEIMNTLSPISSLSQTLLQTQDREMIQQGLEVIAQSSEDLHTFVDNYRRLTRLPTPHFTEVELSVLVVREVQLLDPLIPVNLNTPHSVVTADRGMISQVVVNLL
ncbi:MAG: PAS domain S-box protein, partial [Rikenellaceae bacterium]